jgi:hypothetical protein
MHGIRPSQAGAAARPNPPAPKQPLRFPPLMCAASTKGQGEGREPPPNLIVLLRPQPCARTMWLTSTDRLIRASASRNRSAPRSSNDGRQSGFVLLDLGERCSGGV